MDTVRQIRNLTDFIEVIVDQQRHENLSICYRGHVQENWKIEPYLFRTNKILSTETTVLKSAIALQPSSFINDMTMFERLVRVQHSSLPTRLLDVSWNPLIALYFCVRSNFDHNGEVIVLACESQIVHYFDSNIVSCIANTVLLNLGEREILRNNSHLDIVTFNKLEPTRRLLDFVQVEKPYFGPTIDPHHLTRAILVKPRVNIPKTIVHNGAFIIFGINNESLKDDYDNIIIQRIVIKSFFKKRILNQLNILGINDETMLRNFEITIGHDHLTL